MGWLFSSLRGYQTSWLRGDLLAGLSVWAVLIPEALAYASIAGVSPVVGLYAAPGALIAYAALGSSRHLSMGPMSAAAVLSAATVGALVPATSDRFTALTVALAVAVGLIALIAGMLRLGFLASFISQPVLKGFIIGLALTVIVRQLPKLLGVEAGTGNFFQQLWHLITNLGDTHGLTALVGGLSLAVIIGLRHAAPVVPGTLVAVLLGIVAVKLFDLDAHGVAIVGSIKSGLPHFGLPHVHGTDVGGLAAGGFGVMLVCFAEGLGAAKTYAAREHEQIDADRELLGLGAANLAAAVSSGMVVAGSLSKTAVNVSGGARTQLSGLFVAALSVVTLLALTGPFEDLPEATLAAVVIAAVYDLVDVPGLVALYGAYTHRLGREFGLVARPDFIAAMAALLGVTVFGTLSGLVIGIVVSLLLLIYRASRPYIATLGRTPGPGGHYRDIERHPDARIPDQVVVLRVESGLYFANADMVRTTILKAASQPAIRAVVLDAETVPFIDVTAARMLADVALELEDDGLSLLIAREVGQVRDVVQQVIADVLATNVYPSVEAAVESVDGAFGRGG